MTQEKKQTVLLLHGFASSERSTKARFFRTRFGEWPDVSFAAINFNPTPADFRYITTTGMIDRLRQYVVDRDLPCLRLIGSSFGGLVAVHYAHRYGGVDRMLLLAPALVSEYNWITTERIAQWQASGETVVYHFDFQLKLPIGYDLYADGQRYREFVPPAAPALIIHGTHDEMVPVVHSREYAARWPEWVRLIEVDAGHELNGHLDFIWEQAREFLLAAED